MSAQPPRPHRPALRSDLTALIDAAGGTSTGSRAEIAAATAAAVVHAGRDADGDDAEERFVDLADRVGLDTLAALWRDADPVSLAGALWALYLLRQWCRTSPEEVSRLWRRGEAAAPADAVVAGVSDYADHAAMQRAADAVLTGAYRGDFAVALERAAAMFRVLAAGRRDLAARDVEAQQDAPGGAGAGTDLDRAAQLDRAARNDRVAAGLATAAVRWREGTLH